MVSSVFQKVKDTSSQSRALMGNTVKTLPQYLVEQMLARNFEVGGTPANGHSTLRLWDVSRCSVRTMKSATCVQRRRDLQHTLRQVAVVLFGDLCAVGWSLKHGRVVVHILHVYHHCGVVLLQVVRGRQAQLILSRTTNNILLCPHACLEYHFEAHSLTS